MSGYKWVADRVLPVWDKEQSDVITLSVRRHGRNKFSWSARLDFVPKSGVDQIEGRATSLRQAKQFAESASWRLAPL